MTTLHEQLIEQVYPYYQLATEFHLLKFEVTDDWLAVYVKENLDAQGKDFKYKLVCAQSLKDYNAIINEKETLLPISIINRINLMLAETLRSALQDINILYENKKTRD